MNPLRRSAALLCLAGALATPSLAGPLTPPAGPVAPTHRTLTQVEPRTPLSAQTTPGDEFNVFRITQPGTYYLAADITVPAGKNGVTITAPDVTLDLGGFMIRGEPGSLAGVATVETARLMLANGRIGGLGGHGVNALAAPDSRLADLFVLGCAGRGIVLGPGSTADRCTAQGCEADGIYADGTAIIRDCVAAANGDDGIRLQGRSQALRCTARDNEGVGVVASGHANIIRDCTLLDNHHAINLQGTGALVTDNYCTGYTVGWSLIVVSSGATDNALIGNVVMGTGEFANGLTALGSGNLIARNRAAGNAFYNLGSGNAAGPIVNAAALPANTSPDANYLY